MTALPNPFLTSAPVVMPVAEQAAAPEPLSPVLGAAAGYLSDEPIPLCLTEPHEEIDRGIEAILRVIFGIYDRPGTVS
jgi:hypothetical protein